MADMIESKCSNEPASIGSKTWNEWLNNHSDMPYVNQLPVDTSVKKWINKCFRFDLK